VTHKTRVTETHRTSRNYIYFYNATIYSLS